MSNNKKADSIRSKVNKYLLESLLKQVVFIEAARAVTKIDKKLKPNYHFQVKLFQNPDMHCR